MCHTFDFLQVREFPSATAMLAGDVNDGDSSDPLLNLNDAEDLAEDLNTGDPSLNLNEAMAMSAYGRGL
jgi:hypothetical protein